MAKKSWRYGVEPRPHAPECNPMIECICGATDDYVRRLNEALIRNGQPPITAQSGKDGKG